MGGRGGGIDGLPSVRPFTHVLQEATAARVLRNFARKLFFNRSRHFCEGGRVAGTRLPGEDLEFKLGCIFFVGFLIFACLLFSLFVFCVCVYVYFSWASLFLPVYCFILVCMMYIFRGFIFPVFCLILVCMMYIFRGLPYVCLFIVYILCMMYLFRGFPYFSCILFNSCVSCLFFVLSINAR